MKCIIALLLSCMLLAGCAQTALPAVTPVPTAPMQDATPVPEAEEVPEPTAEPETTETPVQDMTGTPLLDLGTSVNGQEHLLQIPHTAIDGMTDPEIYLYQNSLICSELIMDEDNSLINLKRIALEDGALLAENSYFASGVMQVQIGSGSVILCDSATGEIRFLDADLQETAVYTLSNDGDYWYVDESSMCVYIFAEDRVICRELESGADTVILENIAQGQTMGRSSSYIIFSYVDCDDQMTYCISLESGSGLIEPLPVKGVHTVSERFYQLWLLGDGAVPGSYLLADEEKILEIRDVQGTLHLLPGRGNILGTYEDGAVLRLFDREGTLLSAAKIPSDTLGVPGEQFVWSGYWSGYFFTVSGDAGSRLMYWNPDHPVEGENLVFAGETEIEEDNWQLADLYDQAENMSERYGVTVLVGERCDPNYSHFNAYALTDPAWVKHALDVLDGALSAFPEGFLAQLPHGTVREVRFEIVGGISAKEGTQYTDEGTSGFAQDEGDSYLVALDGFLLSDSVIYHELSHVIDRRLAWDASLREGALFDEDEWMALQPEGFAYAESYVDLPDSVMPFIDSGAFYSDYSLTWPTEDRAEIFSAAMCGYRNDFDIKRGMLPKLDYISRCIRDCFDTAGWPETTLWEEMLRHWE